MVERKISNLSAGVRFPLPALMKVAGFFLDGYYCLDNYSPFQFIWKGKLYPTVEHAYQAAHFFKTNPKLAEEIRLCYSPVEAFELANKNNQYDDPDWKDIRIGIMEEILRAKLDQNKFVKDKLITAKNKIIVEKNKNDSFWGWGQDHKGQNNLGKIWMKLRDEILNNKSNYV